MNNIGNTALDNLPCGIFSFTDEGLITFINKTLLTQLGYVREELEGASVEKIFTISSGIFYQTHFSPLIRLQKKVDEIFLNLKTKNKEVIPVLLNALNSCENNTSINTCVCITVYERQKYESEIILAKKAAENALQKNEELEKAKALVESSNQELDRQLTQLRYRNKELLQLNDLIAHDLQEPIRKITLFLDLVLKDESIVTNPKLMEPFEVVIKSAQRMRSVLQSLQEYMLISISNLVKTRVDLKLLVTTQLKNVSEEHPEVQFTSMVDDLPFINADEKQLGILFRQLFKNSFQFKTPGEDLHIQVSGSEIQENFYNSTEGRYKYIDVFRLSVEDNGTGFDEKYSELIFKILKKLDSKSTNLGFGLAICKRIAENHRGYIFASSPENKGAKITVALPVN